VVVVVAPGRAWPMLSGLGPYVDGYKQIFSSSREGPRSF